MMIAFAVESTPTYYISSFMQGHASFLASPSTQRARAIHESRFIMSSTTPCILDRTSDRIESSQPDYPTDDVCASPDIEWDVQTRAIHSGLSPDPTTGAILTPIYQTTTYVQDAVGQDRGFTYSRAGNPTVYALEKQLAALEGVDVPAVAYSSGLAAITALFLAETSAGDTVICSDVVYGGTVRLCKDILSRFGVRAVFVDTSDINAVEQALTDNPQTRIVFIESPANPTLKLTDIQAVATVAHAFGATVAVDNTFLTAALQKPIDLGADIAVYSTTKYIEGHNSTVGGALITKDSLRYELYKHAQKTLGAPQSPWEAWLTIRGLKTLPFRIRQHSIHALEIARWLEADERVATVYYPGLPSFSQHELANRQHINQLHGGMISFEIQGGASAGITLMNNVELCSLAENLGAVETLITHPASMTHASYADEERDRLGITDGLVRLSVGLEHPRDIIADLDRALHIACT